MCLSSFIRHGHKFCLYSYDKIDVPQGVELRDAGEILPEDQYFSYADGPGRGSPSAFSNLFRYEMLYRYGDWWADTDVVCVSDTPPKQDLVYARQDTAHINGAVLKIPQGHNLAFELAAEARALGKTIAWGQAGPQLITRIVKKNSLEKYCVPTGVLYPLNYDEALLFLLPEHNELVVEKSKDAAFIHLWNEILKRSAIRKDIAPPPGSYLHRQFELNGISFPSNLVYTEREIQFISENSFIARYRMELERNAAIEAYEDIKSRVDSDRIAAEHLHTIEDIYGRINSLSGDLHEVKNLVLERRPWTGLIERIIREFVTMIKSVMSHRK